MSIYSETKKVYIGIWTKFFDNLPCVEDDELLLLLSVVVIGVVVEEEGEGVVSVVAGTKPLGTNENSLASARKPTINTKVIGKVW